MLRNLKKYGASRKDLLDVYIKQCRCVLELAAPVWSAGISEMETKQLERVQKTAFAIILGRSYVSYDQALEELEMESLEDRRLDLCISFAKKAQKHEKFQNWFELSDSLTPTTYQPVPCRTKRFKKSPLPYLTALLNSGA